jgi:hypothetical protein
MDPLYTCDFCLKLFTENQLERCCNCGEIFCIKCVPISHVVTLTYDKEEADSGKHKLYYCTEVCMIEDMGAPA